MIFFSGESNILDPFELCWIETTLSWLALYLLPNKLIPTTLPRMTVLEEGMSGEGSSLELRLLGKELGGKNIGLGRNRAS